MMKTEIQKGKLFLSTCIENKTRPIGLSGKDDVCHFRCLAVNWQNYLSFCKKIKDMDCILIRRLNVEIDYFFC